MCYLGELGFVCHVWYNRVHFNKIRISLNLAKKLTKRWMQEVQ